MTMNRDVFLSILAMDSYNRGYGEGLRVETQSQPESDGGSEAYG